MFNLKTHSTYWLSSSFTTEKDKKTQRKAHLNSDIEIRKASDQRLYALNVLRAFPCEPPSSSKASALISFLRPEFLKNHKTALSSDVFS
jgi:hypothetical protein